jgi:hypothetical protein
MPEHCKVWCRSRNLYEWLAVAVTIGVRSNLDSSQQLSEREVDLVGLMKSLPDVVGELDLAC